MDTIIAIITIIGVLIHLVLRHVWGLPPAHADIPLYVVTAVGGLPLVWELLKKIWAREFGADLLAGLSIVTAALLNEYLVASIVILMLSGGEALEALATRRASSVLAALARRMPSTAHRRVAGDGIEDISVNDIQVGDELTIFPHEICPVDGVVVEGHGEMDESYLTGEPFEMSKTTGAHVISGSINGDTALVIRAERLAVDSRYARIMKVMQQSEQLKPRLRRLGDSLGAWFTPVAVSIAAGAWVVTGDSMRFLAVLVIATPCPLLIAIPVAIIGAISLAARRGIIIKSPAILEQLSTCHTLILDKTGTLTFGRPQLVNIVCAPGMDRQRVLEMASSVEVYSKHPLSHAIQEEARRENLPRMMVHHVTEIPGKGLQATVDGHTVQLVGRSQSQITHLPPIQGGLECVVIVDNQFAALFQFRDTPRSESKSFIHHLSPKHHMQRVVLLSGDRGTEVKYLADAVGINEIYSNQSPEQKVEFVRDVTKSARTVFVGDGINDAPALLAATVGIAFGSTNEITTEAAGAVILEPSLIKVDELFHIGLRMRQVALQSALGGMLLSIAGMACAAAGYLPPIAGAIGQEVLDLIAVLNAVRVAFPPKRLTDFE